MKQQSTCASYSLRNTIFRKSYIFVCLKSLLCFDKSIRALPTLDALFEVCVENCSAGSERSSMDDSSEEWLGEMVL